MKTNVLKKGSYILTGQKVLKTIQDTSTPGVDLLIREAVQNSLDAVLESKQHGIISFNIGQFSNSNLANHLVDLTKELNDKFGNELTYDYLAISDKNTCGLLGDHILDETKEKPNNLYNLVYDFMNGKRDSNAGGSWGVGKSVYYRYGNGICFYYSRTYENGEYIHKLAGALIQDEESDMCLLGNRSSGIAFIGDIIQNVSTPIYDYEKIIKFLEVFGLEPYKNQETGTVVIIPYLNKDLLLNNSRNQEQGRFWSNNLSESIKMSLQRWYFPRINNEKFNGKYFICAVNGEKLELNAFFQKMQDLYNGDVENMENKAIQHRTLEYADLGCFKYKKFHKSELNIEVPPNNLPSPYALLDIERDNENENPQILFYLRKPGMVITYDVDKFGTFNFFENEYLLGMFVLNDNLVVQNENLGNYIRATEKANHMAWEDSIVPNFNFLSQNRPFKKICRIIKAELKEKFALTKDTDVLSAKNVWQKELGKLLMPPEDFGKEPQIRKKKNEVLPKLKSVSKKKKIIQYFDLFWANGNLSYAFEMYLDPRDKAYSAIKVKASGKDYDIDEWEKLGFKIPCSFEKFKIEDLWIGSNSLSIKSTIDVGDDFLTYKGAVDKHGQKIYAVRGLSSLNKKTICGFEIVNLYDKPIRLKVVAVVKPLDYTYSICFRNEITSNNGGIN